MVTWLHPANFLFFNRFPVIFPFRFGRVAMPVTLNNPGTATRHPSR
jgi:hypothetical protein